MNPFYHALLADDDESKEVFEFGESLSYTWFGRPNYAWDLSSGKYWFGSTKDIEGGTSQHVTEYDINTQTYTTTRVGTVFEKDDHNQAQILVRNSDQRLIAFYVEHISSFLRYKISTNPLDSTSWGEENTLNPSQQYSYISPYQASNGDIFIFFRTRLAFDFHPWGMMRSTDQGETFGEFLSFFEPVDRGYLITYQDGDVLHFCATNGHPQSDDVIVNIYHFYFDMINRTFHKSNGNTITAPLLITDITLVQQFSNNNSSWNLDITTKNGKPRMLYVRYPDGRINNFLNKELWFVEWNGSLWINNQKIADTLSGYIEDDEIIDERAYPPASRFDVTNPDIIWMSKQVNGILEIHKVDLRGIDIYIEQLTFDSPVDNWRPISVKSTENNLLWIVKNNYNTYNDYDMGMATLTVDTS